jgi:hypothetical protein
MITNYLKAANMPQQAHFVHKNHGNVMNGQTDGPEATSQEGTQNKVLT